MPIISISNLILGNQKGGSTLTPRTSAFIAATGITDQTIINALNTYDQALIAGSLVTGAVALYPTVGGTASTHKWNFFNPVDSNASKRLTFSGTITHGSNGMQGNGSNGVANSFINPSTDLNGDFCMWHYSRTTTTSGGSRCDAGVIAAGANPGVYMGFQTHANSAISANCDINTGLGAIANTGGFFLIKRVGNTVTVKRNDVTIQTFTAPNTSYQNGNIQLMAALVLPSTILNYSNKQYTDFGFYKATFTSGMDTAAYNAVLGKETLLGRNV